MKVKILNEALRLYNEIGISKVTARLICKNLGISLGSFSYHFPDKRMIIEALYHRMLEDQENIYTNISTSQPNITTYLKTHQDLFLIQKRYKFFYLNLFEILSGYNSIKDIYLKKAQFEKKLAQQMVVHYVNAGVLKPSLSTTQIDRLINVGQILNNFWTIDAELLGLKNLKNELSYYMDICCGLLLPYLSEQAAVEYDNFFNQLN